MKTRLHITVDHSVLQQARQLAHTRGMSLSALVESALRRVAEVDSAPYFTASWRGPMVMLAHDTPRLRTLAARHD
jgi:hypothetical protein